MKDEEDPFLGHVYTKKLEKNESLHKTSKKNCKKIYLRLTNDTLFCTLKPKQAEGFLYKIPLARATITSSNEEIFTIFCGGDEYLFICKSNEVVQTMVSTLSKMVTELSAILDRQEKILNVPIPAEMEDSVASPARGGSTKDLKENRNIYESTGALVLRSQEETDFVERGLGNYNKLFQEAYERLLSTNDNTPVSSKLDISLELIHLAEDFINSARRYGRIIISEVFLPVSEKTIKPAKLGGVIGGEKYIVQNILFKFAIDKENVFGGDDSSAMKVAGHELKGLKSYLNAGIAGLSFPLMATIETKGFKVIASALLPLKPPSIIYGSDDAGITIHVKDPQLNKKLEEAALKMNIKPHLCGNRKSVMMYSCVDLEGHKGIDDRHYILDFSRIMPPVTPSGAPGGHLYMLFRAEFVKQYKLPLCSDAYSRFVQNQPDSDEHKKEVDEATRHLLNVVVPEFAQTLIKTLDETKELRGDITSFRLTEYLHSFGINVRYLGQVLMHLPQKTLPSYRTFLIVEMIARVAKNMIRNTLRNTMKKIEVPIDEPYRKEAINMLNKIFGKPNDYKSCWQKMRQMAIHKFGISNLQLLSFPADLRAHIFGGGKEGDKTLDFPFLLFSRIQQMMGFRFTSTLIDFLSKHRAIYDYARVFDETDLEDLGERVKHLDIISNAKGFLFTTRANEKEKSGYFVAARYLYEQGLVAYEEALNSSPNDSNILKNCAVVLVKIEKLTIAETENKKRIADIKISLRAPLVARANSYYKKAIQVDGHHSSSIAYATFLEDCGAVKEAEENYLVALEKAPNNVYYLQKYSQFLQYNKQDEISAQAFLDRVQKLSGVPSQLPVSPRVK